MSFDVDDLVERYFSAVTSGDYTQGRELIDRAVGLAPANARVWLARGEFLEHMGELEEALDCFEQVEGLAPGDYAAHMCKARVLDRLIRPEDALESYQQACQIAPDLPDPWLRFGALLARLGMVKPALTALRTAETLAPAEVEAKRLQGELLAKLGRLEEAVTAYGEARRVARHHGPTRAALARLLGRLGRTDAANEARPERDAEHDPGELFELRARHPDGREVALRYRTQGRAESPEFELECDPARVHHVARRLLEDACCGSTEVLRWVGGMDLELQPSPTDPRVLDLTQPLLSEEAEFDLDVRTRDLSDALRAQAAADALTARLGIGCRLTSLYRSAKIEIGCLFQSALQVRRVPPVDDVDSGFRVGPLRDFEQALLNTPAPPLGVLVGTHPRLLPLLSLPVGWRARVRGNRIVSVRDANQRERLR